MDNFVEKMTALQRCSPSLASFTKQAIQGNLPHWWTVWSHGWSRTVESSDNNRNHHPSNKQQHLPTMVVSHSTRLLIAAGQSLGTGRACELQQLAASH